MTSGATTVLWDDPRERLFMVVMGAVFTALFIILVGLSGGRLEAIVFLPVLAGGLVLLRSVAVALAGMVIMLFTSVTMSYFASSVVFSVVVALAVLIHQRDLSWRALHTPLSVPLTIYGCAVLPSLVNAVDPLHSIALMFNMVAFLVAMYATYVSARDLRSVRRLAWWFLGMVILNAVVLILVALSTGQRQYGFATIMYVDYAGLGLCILASMTIMAKRRRRWVLLSATLLVGAALILTQTRNAWISAFVTLVVSVLYLARHPSLTGLSRSALIRSVMVGLMVLVILATLVVLVNPSIADRAASTAETEAEASGETVVVKSSLITRMMIWEATLNAFLSHPFVGIGVYGFAKASRQYSHLPRVFYDLYVRDLSPHVTFFAVLAETGLVGMAGFLVFLVGAMRVSLRTVRTAANLALQRRAFLGLVGVVYCTVSMFFTDAWLWGHGIVLLGLIIGLVLANRRISERHRVAVTPADTPGSEE